MSSSKKHGVLIALGYIGRSSFELQMLARGVFSWRSVTDLPCWRNILVSDNETDTWRPEKHCLRTWKLWFVWSFAASNQPTQSNWIQYYRVPYSRSNARYICTCTWKVISCRSNADRKKASICPEMTAAWELRRFAYLRLTPSYRSPLPHATVSRVFLRLLCDGILSFVRCATASLQPNEEQKRLIVETPLPFRITSFFPFQHLNPADGMNSIIRRVGGQLEFQWHQNLQSSGQSCRCLSSDRDQKCLDFTGVRSILTQYKPKGFTMEDQWRSRVVSPENHRREWFEYDGPRCPRQGAEYQQLELFTEHATDFHARSWRRGRRRVSDDE